MKQKTKKILSAFLVAVMLLASIPLQGLEDIDWSWLTIDASAATYDGTCGDNLTWILDDETGVLTISGSGDMSDYKINKFLGTIYLLTHPWKSYKSDIKTIVISDGVTSIGNYAFAKITSLETVIIPDSVVSIGIGAFIGCAALKSIAVPNESAVIGEYAFGYTHPYMELYDGISVYGPLGGELQAYSLDKIPFFCIHGYEDSSNIVEIKNESTSCGNKIEYECAVCFNTWTSSNPLEHNFVLEKSTCTCIDGGADIYVCSKCGDVRTETFSARHADADNDGFCDYCLEPFGGVLDLVFVIDSTGSMSGEVNVVKESIQTYADMLSQSNIPHYIALIDYSNDISNNGTNRYYNVNFDFTNDKETIRRGISNLTLKSGSDEPAYSAIINGLDELHWGVNSTRRIILIGDEEPWSPESATGFTYDSALESLEENEISVYSIATGGSDVSSFKSLAEETNGQYYQSNDSTEFANTLMDIIDTIPESIHIHDYQETVVTAATCLKDGLASYKCVGCGRELKNMVVPALGHNYVSVRIEATDEMEEHTCYTCSQCNDSYIVLDPAVPVEGFIAVAGTYKVSLSWLKSVEASVTGYNIYRKVEDETEYQLIKTINSRNTVSFVDENLTAGYEHTYIITALKDKVEGMECEPISCVPNSDTEQPRVFKLEPSKVLNDVITGTVKFSVNAEDNIGVVKFELYYCVENSDDWSLISEQEGATAEISFDTKTVDDGRYSFKAVAYDAKGNSSDGDLIRTYTIDNTGPEKVKGLEAKAIYASKATISWENVSDKDINHFILRRKSENGYVIVSNSITGVLGYNLESLTPETEYTYSVAGVDHYGNVGEYSDDFTFTTVADSTVPVISSVLPGPGRFNKTINFVVTAEDDYNIQKIEIIASDDLNEWTVIEDKEFTNIVTHRKQSFSISLDEFAEGNLFLAAVAYDSFGNCSPSGDEAAYVQYVVDKTAPNAPENVKATGEDRVIVVSWNQGLENDLGTYNVYRSESDAGEFKLIASNLKKLDYYDAAVQDGVTYYYKVSVSDSCGNVSGFSNVVFANLRKDFEKPVIRSVGLGNGNVCGPSNKTIGAVAQDNKLIKEIVIEYRLETDEAYTVLASKVYESSNYYKILEADLPFASFNDGAKIYVRAYCKDAAGLVSEYSADSVITVDKTAPTVNNVDYTLNGSNYTLTWTDNNESDISGYKVYYSKDGESYKVMATRGYVSYGTYSVSVELDSGSYDVKIESIDKVGNSIEYNCPSVTIQGSDNFELQAKIDCPLYFEAGVEETVSAVNSVSSEGIVSYRWDFGDNSTSEAKQPNKRYTETGKYQLKLTVEDAKGNIATTSKNIVVKERELLGTVRAVVVDDSSMPLANAEVYFGLGEDNQQAVYTNSSGVAELVMSAGTHSIGALSDTKKYLPAEASVDVIAGETTEVKLILVQKPLIDLDLECHEMTFEEIIASGIDVSDPANRQLISGTITVKYTTTGGSTTGTKIIDYISTTDRIIDYTVTNPSPSNTGKDDSYVFTPVLVSGDKGGEIVAVLVMPAEASFLKQFYDVTLHVTNNAESKFSISDCNASLSVPSGLTIINSTPIASTIEGGSTSAASWIVRGDTKGEYYVSANFSGNLDLFNKHVSAGITSSEPIAVRGLDGITLRAVFNSMIKCNTLYFNLILENDSGYDIYYPDVDYQKLIDNLMIDAPKKEETSETVTECLGVSLISADDIAETFDTDTTFDVLHDGEKIKYEFKTSGLANDDVVGYYTEGTVDCLPQFKDHIVVEEDYIYSYDGD